MLHQAILLLENLQLEHIQEKDLHLRILLVLMNTLLLVVAVVVMILDLVVNQEHLQPTHQVAVALDKIIHHQIHIILVMEQTVKQELVVSQHHLMEPELGLDMQIMVEPQQVLVFPLLETLVAVVAVPVVLVIVHQVAVVLMVVMESISQLSPIHLE